MATTQKQFGAFKREVERWVEYFGLTTWTVHVLHYRASKSSFPNIAADHENIAAWAGFTEWGNQSVTVCLNKEYVGNIDLDEDELSKTAYHEVMHLLLRNLTCMAVMRFGVTEEMVDAEVHNIIAILENAVWAMSDNSGDGVAEKS